MLPTGKRDKGTAVQILLYTLWTVVVSLIPALGVTGTFYITPISALLILVLGIFLMRFAMRLYKYRDGKVAKQLMLMSVLYITLLQIIYVADKFIRLWI